MTDEEINALAREYADMMKRHFPNMPEYTYRDKIFQAKNVIDIIMQDYCIVEKSKLDKLDIAFRAKHYDMVILNPSEVQDLFPELFKDKEI